MQGSECPALLLKIANIYIYEEQANISIAIKFIFIMEINRKFKISGYIGNFSSFLDGGNILRYWIIKVFSGSFIAIVLAIITLAISFILWHKRTRT
ncbi:hypothetical protein [Clostridium thermarum]|uniref:hypothetical protein n=1 Tax=Clostridium thermarum TaxID=1716543 RepID=UPI0013D40BB7|nr:hypothetical protein [Clostridium thermarum]